MKPVQQNLGMRLCCQGPALLLAGATERLLPVWLGSHGPAGAGARRCRFTVRCRNAAAQLRGLGFSQVRLYNLLSSGEKITVQTIVICISLNFQGVLAFFVLAFKISQKQERGG